MEIPSERRVELVEHVLVLLGGAAPDIEGLLLVHRLRLRGLSNEKRQGLERRLSGLAEEYPEAAFSAHATALAASRALEQGRLTEAAALARNASLALGRVGETQAAAVALLAGAMAWTQAGELDRAREAYIRTMRSAAAARLHYIAGVCAMALAGLHRMRCEFDVYEQFMALIPADNWTRQIFAAERAEHAGDAERCISLLPSPALGAGVAEWELILSGSRARMLYNASGPEAARTDFDRWRSTLATLVDDPESLVESITSATPLETALGLADECFAAMGSDDDVARMYQRLVAHGWIRTGGDFRQLDRVRGALALRLGLADDAEHHFSAGLEWCERERCPIEAGRCLQGLAEVAGRRGDQIAAIAYLNRAALAFSGIEAQFFLGQVLAAKLRLQGALGLDPESSIDLVQTAGAPALAAAMADAGPTDVTIVFTDIDESTPLAERLGDSAWVGVLRAHNAIVRAAIARFGGREIKTIGDAFMVAFKEPTEAIEFSVSLQRSMAARNARADVPVQVTVGIHTGRAVDERGDFIGLDVVVAARVCGACPPGQVLVTGAVRDAAGSGHPYSLSAKGAVALKGISVPHPVFAIDWEAT
jgi:class 3 adenylate cyclase